MEPYSKVSVKWIPIPGDCSTKQSSQALITSQPPPTPRLSLASSLYVATRGGCAVLQGGSCAVLQGKTIMIMQECRKSVNMTGGKRGAAFHKYLDVQTMALKSYNLSNLFVISSNMGNG